MRAPESVVRCGIYARISLDSKDTGDGVARQVAECEQLAAQKGWTVFERYIDNSISASDPKKVRPEFERLLADMAAGRLEAVIAWHPDRLYRRMTDLDRVAETIGKSGVQVATVKAGEVDFTTASGRQIAAMMAVVARGEVERLGERLSAKYDQSYARGQGHNGRRPFGWRWKDPCPGGEECQHPEGRCQGDGKLQRVGTRRGLVPDEREAPILRGMYERIARGDSLYSVAAWLNGSGITGARGGSWTGTTVQGNLRITRHAGFVVRNGVETQVPDGDRIVDRDLYDDVLRILDTPGRSSRVSVRARKESPRLVQGLAVCGDCGRVLCRGALTRTGQPTLTCIRLGAPSIHHFTRRADPIDEFVLAAVQRVLAANAEPLSAAAAAVPDTDSEDRRRAMGQLRTRIADANRAYREGRVEMEIWLDVVTPLQAELKALEAMRDRTAPRPLVAAIAASEDVGRAIAGFDDESVRALTRELIAKVEVWSPGHGAHVAHNGIAIRWQEWTGLVDIEPVWVNVKGDPVPRPAPWQPPIAPPREIRQWASEQGITVRAKNIPKSLYEAYAEAHGVAS